MNEIQLSQTTSKFPKRHKESFPHWTCEKKTGSSFSLHKNIRGQIKELLYCVTPATDLEIRHNFASPTRAETREEHLNENLLRLACNILQIMTRMQRKNDFNS